MKKIAQAISRYPVDDVITMPAFLSNTSLTENYNAWVAHKADAIHIT